MRGEPDPAAEEAWAEGLAHDAERLFVKIERARRKLWTDYLTLADMLGDLSRLAIRRSGANNRKGSVYARAMSGLLATHAPKLNGNGHAALRAALISINEHRDDVETWRGTWTSGEHQKWQSPITVWRHFEAKFLKDPKGAQRAEQAEQHKADYVRRAAEEVEQKDLENRRLRVNALLDCDNAEVCELIWETRSDEDVADIIARLQEGRPRGTAYAEGWPLVARAAAEDEAEEAPE
jgi:hypothetical protein